MKKILLSILIILFPVYICAINIEKIEPQNWWVDMKTNEIELLVYGESLIDTQVELYAEHTQILKVENSDSPNYLFITLRIGEKQKAEDLEFIFKKGQSSKSIKYPLLSRENNTRLHQGFDASDVIYLLMPDRFANGNPKNDTLKSMRESADKNNSNGRHGGDIEGIEQKLDYLKDLGVTAIWPTPLWESNHNKNSYHGYAATDFYKIDPRYGDNESYKKLVKAMHKHGLKMIMDLVPNHCSISHPWIDDLPMTDWIHERNSKYDRALAISAWTDPYVSDMEFKLNKDGWFSPLMPDLNQNNEKLLRYLTQNAIWWVEFAGLDGLRIDTYPYCERAKIAKWTKDIMNEYPNLNIVGEVWQPQVSSVAYWQRNANNKDGFNSNLPCVMDFPLMDAMKEAFSPNGEPGRRKANKLFGVLAQDYLYADKSNIMTFLDNHDTERFATLIDGDKDLYKVALAFLLTTRGIPQLYYGTELMMNSTPEGIYTSNANRKRIEGAWKGDTRNAFTKDGRTKQENEIFNYLKALLNWRKQSSLIHTGEMTHFKPNDGTYVYFRHDKKNCVMVILNLNDTQISIDTEKYSEIMKGYNYGENVITNEIIKNITSISVSPKSALILDLKSN